MFCKNCGTQIPDDSNACSNCGTFVNADDASAGGAVNAAENEFDPADFEKNRGIVSYYSFCVPFFWLYYVACKESEYGKFFANNAMILLIFPIVCSVVNIIPVLGWLVYGVAMIFYAVVWVMNFINAFKGHMKPLPLFLGNFKII